MSYAFNDDKSKFSLDPIEEDITNTIESIAPVESIVATANHAIGDYFMLGNTLMVTTSAIAVGETITTSNATPATIQSQIDAIRSSLNCKNISDKIHSKSITFDKNINAIMFGNVVVLEGYVRVQNATPSAQNVVLTIDSGYRPLVDTRGYYIPANSDGVNVNGAIRLVKAKTNGDIEVYLDSSVTASYHMMKIVYIRQ